MHNGILPRYLGFFFFAFFSCLWIISKTMNQNMCICRMQCSIYDAREHTVILASHWFITGMIFNVCTCKLQTCLQCCICSHTQSPSKVTHVQKVNMFDSELPKFPFSLSVTWKDVRIKQSKTRLTHWKISNFMRAPAAFVFNWSTQHINWKCDTVEIKLFQNTAVAFLLEWSSRRPARANAAVCNIVGGFFLIRIEMVLMFQKVAS